MVSVAGWESVYAFAIFSNRISLIYLVCSRQVPADEDQAVLLLTRHS
jgi:hypothetical protein